MQVACVLIPRFALIAAAGERDGLLRRPAGGPARGAAAPGRFGARAAASLLRRRRGGRREVVIPRREARSFLFPLPVSLLGPRLDPEGPAGHELVALLERLGVETLGAL